MKARKCAKILHSSSLGKRRRSTRQNHSSVSSWAKSSYFLKHSAFSHNLIRFSLSVCLFHGIAPHYRMRGHKTANRPPRRTSNDRGWLTVAWVVSGEKQQNAKQIQTRKCKYIMTFYVLKSLFPSVLSAPCCGVVLLVSELVLPTVPRSACLNGGKGVEAATATVVRSSWMMAFRGV